MGATKVARGVMSYRVSRQERNQTPRARREMLYCIVALIRVTQLGNALLFVCLLSVLLLARGYLLKT